MPPRTNRPKPTKAERHARLAAWHLVLAEQKPERADPHRAMAKRHALWAIAGMGNRRSAIDAVRKAAHFEFKLGRWPVENLLAALAC
jgi:hypothetical protein